MKSKLLLSLAVWIPVFLGAGIASAVAHDPKSPDEDTVVLDLLEIAHGGIVNKESVAIDIAGIIIADLYGKEELERQRPLITCDLDDRWLVKGSYNLDRSKEGQGPISLWIRKRDANIMDIYNPGIMKIPPEIRDILKEDIENLRRNAEKDPCEGSQE